ncbi:MAG: endonuclease/exonuclease/phosphatase family protein [Microgenomates group bacterium]|jgi:endonuclease/exonuclease/phosphatase family metal-dependent hydrolase
MGKMWSRNIGSYPVCRGMKLKFITLNIEHGGKLLTEAIEFINNEQPDLLFLQEAQSTEFQTDKSHYKTVSTILSQTTFTYHVFSPYVEFDFDGITILHGNAIFSRYPIEKGEVLYFNGEYEKADFFEAQRLHDFTRLPHAMQTATLQLPHMKVFLTNVHGVWGRDGNDSPVREKMVEIILRNVEGHTSTIVAGDFNFQSSTHSAKMLEKNLNSVFEQRLVSTFNMKRKKDSGYATAAVDMVYLSDDIRVLSSRCPQVEISDHLPLVCELEL